MNQGKTRLTLGLLKTAQNSPADATLLSAQRGSRTTLRFSSGSIHQNFHDDDITVWAKVLCDGRIGVATTSALNAASLKRVIETAVTIAKISPKQKQASLSTQHKNIIDQSWNTFDAATAKTGVKEMVGIIRKLNRIAQKEGMEVAGSFVVGEDELAVLSSENLLQYQPFSVAGLRMVVTKGKSSGFATQVVRNIQQLDPEGAFAQASAFCRLNKNPKPLKPGKYDVLLEPEAVAELLEWLSYITFGAKQVKEGSSFLAGKMGEQIMGSNITILDDGSDPAGLQAPFDYEGTPKRPVVLIENGVAKRVVTNHYYASFSNQLSTGHALPYDEIQGPLASNLFLSPGEIPYEALKQKMGSGLWICRFHYVNGLLDPRQALMTGLTRDGTFQIKNGKVVGAVKNLRFTQSILEAFSNVAALSREQRLVADPAQGFSSVVAPAVLIKDFTFTGQTQ